MPRALQAKLARETDKKAVLCTSFDPPNTPHYVSLISNFVLQHALSRNGSKCIELK